MKYSATDLPPDEPGRKFICLGWEHDPQGFAYLYYMDTPYMNFGPDSYELDRAGAFDDFMVQFKQRGWQVYKREPNQEGTLVWMMRSPTFNDSLEHCVLSCMINVHKKGDPQSPKFEDLYTIGQRNERIDI